VGESLSPTARALLQAAKSDAPQAAARAQIWGGVSSAAGLATAAKGGLGASLAATTTASGKLLVVGALLGSAVTAGFGYAIVREVRIDRRAAIDLAHSAAASDDTDRGMSTSAPNVAKIAQTARDNPSTSSLDVDDHSAGGVRAGVNSGVGEVPGIQPLGSGLVASSTRHVGREDPLGREAALVAEASGAVRRGDPEGALASLDAVRRLGSPRMEPEELSIRVRALRRLGRDAEATETEALLRTKYPDHFLAR
jgi:hypothetical protein